MDCWPPDELRFTVQEGGPGAFNPVGSACKLRVAGVVIAAVGLTESQLLHAEGTAAEKVSGVAGPVTATLCAACVVLPCCKLKETVVGLAVKAGGATVSVSGTTSGLLEAFGAATESEQL